MKNKSTQKPHHQKKTPAKPNRMMWVTIIVILGTAIGIVLWRNYTAEKVTKETITTTPATKVPAKPDQDHLIGRWVRTDSNGNYIIEISSATSTGNLEARYFNPNPIKVGHAQWQKKNGSVEVIIELRDVNYPGSTYTLNFNPSENLLSGNYFQAVQSTNFDVVFARIK